MATRTRRMPDPEDYVPDDDEDDDEEEEERPRRKSAARSRKTRSREDDDDDEDDEPPRKSTRKKSSAKPRRSRRDEDDEDDDDPEDVEDEDDDDEDEEEERPRKKKSSSKSSKSSTKKSTSKSSSKKKQPIAGGWGEFRKSKAASSQFPDWFKPGEEEAVVKFLDDGPFATYRMHWFDELPKGERKGWICLDEIEGECPACGIGDSPQLKALFNVLVFDLDSEEWENKVISAGVRLGNQLESVHEGRQGPLSKAYWALSATGTAGAYAPNVTRVKERDLEEDWEVEPLEEDDIEDMREKAYDSSILDIPSMKEMKRIVRQLDDEED